MKFIKSFLIAFVIIASFQSIYNRENKKREEESKEKGRGGGFGGGRGGGFGGGRGGGLGGLSRGFGGGYNYPRASSFTPNNIHSHNHNHNFANNNVSYYGSRRPYNGYYGYGGYRGYGGYYSSWYPWFRWNWINRVRYYPATYWRVNRRNCSGICEKYAECENSTVTVTKEGNLKCVCEEGDSDYVIDDFCWTPKLCIKARPEGCSNLYQTIVDRGNEEMKKRKK